MKPWWIIVGGIVSLFAGCGSACSISGDVTFDGKAVDNGSSTLTPTDGKGQVAAGPIRQGKYSIVDVTPGPKLVQISAVKPVPFARSSQEMADRAAAAKAKGNSTGIIDPADVIPDNAEGNNVTIEIKSGSQQFHFALKSPPATRP